jgi:hypothetical protein
MSEPELPQPKSPAKLEELFAGIDLVATSQGKEVAAGADDLSLDAEKDLERERQLEELNQTKRVNKAQLRILKALFWLIVLWLVSVMALTAVAGFHLWGFVLSDKVMITYITSTTVSVLGLFHIAARWLFYRKP